MPSNLEIKACIADLAVAESRAISIRSTFSGILRQTDTYFRVANGRLKLREVENCPSQLIYYERIEEDSQRLSNYDIHFSDMPQSLKLVLEKAFGIRCTVAKIRTLYLYGTTRIHLDQVEDLGNFLEFEVPVQESEKIAQNTLNVLIEAFNLNPGDFLLHSYADLMEKAGFADSVKKK
jgi:predicted adenylyl cyclase CyaB